MALLRIRRFLPVFWTYAACYFFGVGMFAFVVAFLPLYAKELGFSAYQVAEINVVGTLATILAGATALELTHRLQRPRTLLLWASLFSFLAFLPLTVIRSYSLLLIAWFVFIYCRFAVSAILDAEAIRKTARGKLRFEHVRTWGSIGFVVNTIILGVSADYFGIMSSVWISLVWIILAVLSAYFCLPHIPKIPASRLPRNSAKSISFTGERKRSLIFLLISMAFCWLSHAPMYVYLSLFLEAHGWTNTEISLAWNVGVVAEILLFVYFPWLERKIALEKLLSLGMIIAGIRWLLLGSFSNPVIVLFAQTLHAFSYGVCYLVSMRLVFRLLPDDLRDRGQGWLTVVGTGAGSLLGRYLAGLGGSTLSSYKEAHVLFLISSLGAFIGYLCARKVIPFTDVDEAIDEENLPQAA